MAEMKHFLLNDHALFYSDPNSDLFSDSIRVDELLSVSEKEEIRFFTPGESNKLHCCDMIGPLEFGDVVLGEE